MDNDNIHFFFEDISFFLSNPHLVSEWITTIIHSENFHLESLNFIFCSDTYLLEINREFLNHDYFTDVITFDNSDTPYVIEGDIFISIDRVLENSHSLNCLFIDELHRVIAHGVLHLLGYLDKSKIDVNLMREKEDKYLSLRNF